MKKVSPSQFAKIADYLFRKLRLFFWRTKYIFQDVEFHSKANISLHASISNDNGKILIGSHSLVDLGVVIRTYGGSITIANDVTIGPYSVLYGGAAIDIGSAVRIGPHVTIVAGNHIFSDRSELIFKQGMKNIGIEIADDVWIGAGARILDGVRIGRGAVIAAGTVVTRSVKDWEVVAGVPAKVINLRGKPHKVKIGEMSAPAKSSR